MKITKFELKKRDKAYKGEREVDNKILKLKKKKKATKHDWKERVKAYKKQIEKEPKHKVDITA